MSVRVDAIRECLEGIIPGHIATCDADGVPNLAYLSQVEYVDADHVALSYQFFNTTRRNVLSGSPVRLLLTSPLTGAQYRLQLHYVRTETAGALFERMRAKLAGIASHTGMSGVFRLIGADVYRVVDIEPVPGEAIAAPPEPLNRLAALRRATERMARSGTLVELVEALLDSLERDFGIAHAMLAMLDAGRGRLYTLASRGYPQSGVGSEIPMGAGVIGTCARERAPIRIGFTNSEYAYVRTVRASMAAGGERDALETEIPLPGLPDPHSQLAVPVVAFEQLLGVLYVESTSDLHFGYDDEDALVALAAQLGLGIAHHQRAEDEAEEPAAGDSRAPAPSGPPVVVRHFPANDSVFLDDEYLIKGVAGAILWALLTDHVERGRTSFTNKGLRLDSRIRLPEVSDNLEARLVLLQRRLEERGSGIRLCKSGRGRLSLVVERPIQLVSGQP